MIFGNKKYFKLAFVFFLVTITSLVSINLFKEKPIYNIELLSNLNKKQFRYIAHASGGIEGLKYTNSLEALNQSINSGYKLIEIDLQKTKDNFIVGVHDWKSFKKYSNYKDNKDEPINYNEFLKLKIHSKLTPLEINIINEIFSKNKDIYLVTDKINDFDKIYNDFSFNKNRIIVEIFGKKNFELALKKKIINPMFSFNHTHYKFVIKNNIKIIAAHTLDISRNKDVYKKLVNKGVQIFAYSSNNKKYIDENIGKYFTHVYSDFWDVNLNKCNYSECETY